MEKRPWYYKLIYLYTWNHDVLVWLVVLAIRYLFAGEKLHWQNGLWCEMRKNSWFGYLGTCMGHGGLYSSGLMGGEGIDTPTEFHEQGVHVEQYEAAMLRAFLFGLCAFIVLAALGHFQAACWTGWAMWQSGYFMNWIPNWIVAVIRGEDYYWGSHHEESAYAQTEKWEREHTKKDA